MKRKLLGLLSVISGFVMSFFARTQIYAEDIKSMLDGEGAAGDGGALAPINNMTDELGKGAFTIGKKGAVYVAAVMILVLGIGFMVYSGNAPKLAEKKSSVLPFVIGAVLVFGSIGVIVFISTIGASLFPTD